MKWSFRPLIPSTAYVRSLQCVGITIKVTLMRLEAIASKALRATPRRYRKLPEGSNILETANTVQQTVHSILKLKDFHYVLPPSLIAQEPLEIRDHSRLMRLTKTSGHIEHMEFRKITGLFNSGDVLVLNDTKVFPARLVAKKPSGGKIEFLLLKQIEENEWEALVRPSYKFKQGAEALVGEHDLRIESLDAHTPEKDSRRIRLHVNGSGPWREAIERFGHVPLPPYIKRMDCAGDRERYQTVFSKHEGAVAAPTAGLHFTNSLLEELKQKGVEIVYVTLHVGYGTFKPVTEEDLSRHYMHEERFLIPQETAYQINARKGRLIACGTTSMRALESASDKEGEVRAGEGVTHLFIYPPYAFKTADVLITNFHLPDSTLLMLAAAFGGYEFVMSAYEEAKRNHYRFFSYGDAMIIER